MANPSPAGRKLIRQVCAIPFRPSTDTLQAPEFCLITSLSKKRWIFPKGIIEDGETEENAALKEAWEEAGLEGAIVDEPLGQFSDQKWGSDLEVQVVLMRVANVAVKWPEIEQRQRIWAPAETAKTLLWRDELREFLYIALRRIDNRDLLNHVT